MDSLSQSEQASHRDRLCELVQRGYSIEWLSSEPFLVTVFLPEDHKALRPELRARIVLGQPDPKHLRGGRIKRLIIHAHHSDILLADLKRTMDKRVDVLFIFDSHATSDSLESNSTAKQLFDDVISILN